MRQNNLELPKICRQAQYKNVVSSNSLSCHYFHYLLSVSNLGKHNPKQYIQLPNFQLCQSVYWLSLKMTLLNFSS